MSICALRGWNVLAVVIFLFVVSVAAGCYFGHTLPREDPADYEGPYGPKPPGAEEPPGGTYYPYYVPRGIGRGRG
jgi:hypothetical protein